MVETRSMKRVRIQDAVQGAQTAFVNILSRVNAKSVVAFKRVSKYWHSFISNKYFAKLQLIQSRKNPSFIACPRMDTAMRLYSMQPGSFELADINTIDPAERNREEDYMYMISSFNGLICCVNCIDGVDDDFVDLQIRICNPCSGETLLLPQGTPSFQFEPSVGVAHGSDMSDYKVFRIFCTGKKVPEERIAVVGYYYRQGGFVPRYSYAMAYECEVYSSYSGSWKNIGPVPCVPMKSFLSPFRCVHVFVGGKIYWIVDLDAPGEILSVDLDGRFEVMGLPEYSEYLHDDDKITEGTHLINLQGSLGMVVLHPDYMDIWVLKKEGEISSWVLECTDDVPFDDQHDMVLTMTSAKNLILCVTQTHWCSYDLDTKIWNTRLADAPGLLNPAVFPFTGSVLPCNGGVRL